MLIAFLVIVAFLVGFIGGAMVEAYSEDRYFHCPRSFWFYLENATLGFVEDVLYFFAWGR